MNSKLAVITGGSSGIGLAMAEVLGSQGYRLILLARNEDKLQNAVESLAQKNIRAQYVIVDVTKEQDLFRAKEKIIQQSERIDFLILSAGIVTVRLLQEYKSISEMKSDVEVDLLGVMQSAYVFGPLLQAGSKVLLISSALGLFGMAGYTAYSAAKAGVLNFGDAWRRELLPRGINLYVATPADVDTPQYRGEMASQPDWMKNQQGPRKSQPAINVARKILRRCNGKYRFLIIPSSDVKLLVFLFRILPISWRNFILDRIFPTPNF